MPHTSPRSPLVSVAVFSVLSFVAIARPAEAGHCRPLCHVFDLGGARSLPWGADWSTGDPSYDVANLAPDTRALLAPGTPVIVRMETIRRAFLYASRDRAIAQQLLGELLERARASERAGTADPLAFLDAAYAAVTLYQIGEFEDVRDVRELSGRVKGLVRAIEAYDLVKKSLALRGDPAVHFAAALIASTKKEHHAFCAEHAQKARAGAAADVLLVRNLRHVS